MVEKKKQQQLSTDYSMSASAARGPACNYVLRPTKEYSCANKISPSSVKQFQMHENKQTVNFHFHYKLVHNSV